MRAHSLILGAALVSATAACASRPAMLKVPLDVAGSSQLTSATVHHSGGLRLYLEPLVDDRSDKSTIGANRERSPEVSVVATGRAPTDFVAKILSSELSHAGLNVVSDAPSANRVLRVRLVRFFTLEGGTYEAEVGAVAEVRDSGGHTLYSYAVTGQAKQWGSSLSADNYDEVFSRAVFDLAKNLIEQTDFQKALDVENGAR